MEDSFIETAKVMTKGQVTIPKDVRDVLGVGPGNRISFLVNNGQVQIVNAAVHAMRVLQKQMDGKAEASGLTSDEAIVEYVKDVRRDNEDKDL